MKNFNIKYSSTANPKEIEPPKKLLLVADRGQTNHFEELNKEFIKHKKQFTSEIVTLYNMSQYSNCNIDESIA